ncbi:MAG: hypothetical protein AAFU85_23120 [Planctomycetota bacterium]
MSATKSAVGAVIVLSLLAAYFLFSGKQYGEVSDQGYRYAQALYSCCNQRDAQRLQLISQMIDDARSRDELDERELKWFREIIQQGREGDWTSAFESIRQLMDDQVSSG